MSLDKIIRPFSVPDIFPAKTNTRVFRAPRNGGPISLTIGGGRVTPKTLTVTNSGQATVYTIKRPTEQ